MQTAKSIIVRGRVQGVGFRPFIFGLASDYNIVGTVQNNMDGVSIIAEGDINSLDKFINAIQTRLPRLAKIYEFIVRDNELAGFENFSIIESSKSGTSSLVIPIDASICPDCSEELLNKDNKRYNYPFINCTQCGPRYSIISALPYDRPYTSMENFKMCAECREEYDNPLDRRHHAQPNACEICGPKYELYRIDGTLIEGNIVENVAELIKSGNIVAIKGIGGYHLVCDATNESVVNKLRQRKNRPSKPLAIMAKNIDGINNICIFNNKERDLLQSIEAPIVLLNKRSDSNIIAESVAPKLSQLGVMMPYTPFHVLLFNENNIKYLVMTSANPSGLPMLYKDCEAFTYLNNIADYIVSNNREILHAIDDSVVQVIESSASIIRRARGYVPEPITTQTSCDSIIALGSQQKNTFSIGRNSQIFIGPHIGDLNSVEVYNHFLSEFNHLNKWMGVNPMKIAIDLHPSFTTNELAKEFSGEIVKIQHHHAHLVSCMVDNNIRDENVIGIILDGTGYGTDGNIWGFEILEGNEVSFERLAHLRYTNLPGGDKSIIEPWKNAVGMLYSLLGERGKNYSKKLFKDQSDTINIICNMIDKNLNSPLAGTCGRLFDAVSSILGVCTKTTYDGEAAIILSNLADLNLINQIESYSYDILNEDNLFTIDFSSCLERIIEDKFNNVSNEYIATRFHQTVVNSIIDTIILLDKIDSKIVLSGGSFHNPYLLLGVKSKLNKLGFEVYSHRNIPTNDGGLSLGQLVFASKL
jgi:hydrogenase maturation protein HypF